MKRGAFTLLVFELKILTKNPLKEGLKSYLKPPLHHQGPGAHLKSFPPQKWCFWCEKKKCVASLLKSAGVKPRTEIVEKWHNATGYFVPIYSISYCTMAIASLNFKIKLFYWQISNMCILNYFFLNVYFE